MAIVNVNENNEAYAVSHSDCRKWQEVVEEYGEIEYFATLGAALAQLEAEMMGVEMTIWCNEKKIGQFSQWKDDNGNYHRDYFISSSIVIKPVEKQEGAG